MAKDKYYSTSGSIQLWHFLLHQPQSDLNAEEQWERVVNLGLEFEAIGPQIHGTNLLPIEHCPHQGMAHRQPSWDQSLVSHRTSDLGRDKTSHPLQNEAVLLLLNCSELTTILFGFGTVLLITSTIVIWGTLQYIQWASRMLFDKPGAQNTALNGCNATAMIRSRRMIKKLAGPKLLR